MKDFWRFLERKIFFAMISFAASLTVGCMAPISGYLETMPLFDAHNHLNRVTAMAVLLL